MKTAILLLCVSLVGCAGIKRVETVEVKVPVIAKCVTDLPERPAYRSPGPDATEAEKVVAVALNWLDSRPYEAKLEAGLNACK